MCTFDNEYQEAYATSLRKGDVAILLKKLGVKPALDGWKYLNEVINIAIEDPDALEQGITKVIYPRAAKTFNSTSSGVEKSIRHAIFVAYHTAPRQTYKAVFGNSINDVPTNREFVAAVVQVIMHEPENLIWSM